ncbi:hydroxyphenylacetyl-CoA thioesterase PaaI [Parahaliea mediterranea]|uniref:Hydroxyphenylacetyl-CoA thioesterase PaaI n=1 Tax=Parahaliea mediterranea TaxID=651086 RepID=A0A939DH20_9GAMM|nr:hydroxyphenylacetyl-CoA thioesterase PaaI [Parahaliea mediterranea]MBN7797362.1 hydroxyphenylacetyl-CoA thioesterase PaaI [Parahaliea mediterranea]
MSVLDAQQLADAAAAAMWSGDRASQGMGMRIESVTPGEAVLSMTVREDMLNGHALCHGGFLFALADSAFAFACNSENHSTVAAGARVEFLAPGKLGDRLTATAKQLHQGGRTGLYDVAVTNQDGRTLAVFRGNAHRIGGNLVDSESGEALL